MARRSSRLASGGYYNSDEESDSSSVTNISYRENPVKVFKKKVASRKAGSRTPSRANSNASSAETPITAVGSSSPSPLNSPTQSTMRTAPYISTTPTPRPPLMPTCCTSAPPEKSPYAGLCSSSRAGLHLRPNNKDLSQSGMDSSGYSSSEGPHRKPSSSRTTGTSSGAPSTGYRSRISSAFIGLMDLISLKATVLQSKIIHLSAVAADASVSRHMKKACGLFLLLLLLLLCLWFLLPLLTSLISRMAAAKTQSQIKPKTQPVFPAATPPPLHPPPPSSPSTMHPSAVLDPAVVSAAVEARIQQLLDPAALSAAIEAKMQRLLEEQQLKQEQLLFQMKARLQQDLQEMRARLEVVDLDGRLRLQQELTDLDRRLLDDQADSRSVAAGLRLQIQALEAQSVKLSQEWSSIQLRLPSDSSSPPVQNQLTPELQEALEKWLSNRIQEANKLHGSCGRPMADKMADFALETQGASVISTRCSETYRIRSACVTLFGFPLWYPSESPRTVIQGFPVLLPGKCWAFHGVQGTLVISLSHPVQLTHVTLDHLPRYSSPTGRIDSAPKDFQVYGLKNDTDEGVLLGTFTYDENGESTQTFELPNPTAVVFRCVELRVLSNWGHVEYTCLYRFRVHGQIAST